MTLVIASDVRRFAPLVTFWGVTAIVFGAVLLGIDLSAGMPAYWTWGDVPYTILVGAVALGLQRRSRGL